MKPTTIDLRFGLQTKSFLEQLRDQGILVLATDLVALENIQKDHDCIARLYVRAVITSKQTQLAYKKLSNQIKNLNLSFKENQQD